MAKLTAKIGLWAAVAETLVSLIYIVGLVMLVAGNLSQYSAAELAAQEWTGILDYAQHYRDALGLLQISLVVQISAFLTGLCILVVFLALHELADDRIKIWARLASTFVLIMAVLSSWGYYIQLASVHQTIITGGDLEGLAQFAESNISSPGMATLQLSWALFYGLGSLFILPAFGSTRSEKWIKAGFAINGIIGIVVGVSYAFGITNILPLAVIGLVGSAYVYPLLGLRFYRISKVPG
jgi:hypothetical protein